MGLFHWWSVDSGSEFYLWNSVNQVVKFIFNVYSQLPYRSALPSGFSPWDVVITDCWNNLSFMVISVWVSASFVTEPAKKTNNIHRLFMEKITISYYLWTFFISILMNHKSILCFFSFHTQCKKATHWSTREGFFITRYIWFTVSNTSTRFLKILSPP